MREDTATEAELEPVEELSQIEGGEAKNPFNDPWVQMNGNPGFWFYFYAPGGG